MIAVCPNSHNCYRVCPKDPFLGQPYFFNLSVTSSLFESLRSRSLRWWQHVSRVWQNKDEIKCKLQSDGNETDMWSNRNNLSIHYGKSTCMTLGTKQKIGKAGKLNISIDDTQINHVSCQKLLGLFIDETLSWNPHIGHLCSVISSRI